LFYKLDNRLSWRYIDFFDSAVSGKSDYEFLQMSWISLFSSGALTNFSLIHIWQDGGAGDFYNTTALFFYSHFRSLFNVDADCSFYVEYHGHHRGDGHIGNGKRKLSKISQLMNRSFTNELVFEAFHRLDHTTATIIDVDHKPFFRAHTFNGIKKYKYFKFPEKGVVLGYTFTGSLEDGEKHIFTLKDPTRVVPSISKPIEGQTCKSEFINELGGNYWLNGIVKKVYKKNLYSDLHRW